LRPFPSSPGLLAVALVLAGCAPAIPLSRQESERLSAAPPIPVVSVRSSPPWVDCPNDEGQKVWEYPGSASGDLEGGSLSVMLASGRAAPPFLPAGGTWESIQDQWTRSLQTPPVDPARATAVRILSRARAVRLPVPLAEPAEEVQRLDPAALGSRFGGSPVLVVEAVRWVLVGCFFTYQPWFDVRATLVRTSTGEILWRDTCGGTYPGGWPIPASRDELEAGGRWLYARTIDERAAACAAQLVASLKGAGLP
jgi:hypothetical protein